MTQFLTFAEVIELHDSESDAPIINPDNLASAVGEPAQTFGGVYLHPTLLEQAAVLLRGVSQAHGFLDGNKRTAWLSCVTFLALNGVELRPVRTETAEKLVKQATTGAANMADITLWLNARV